MVVLVLKDAKVKKCSDICQSGGCSNKSEILVYNRKTNKVTALCEGCSDRLLDEINPEYTVHCQNCGCAAGIN